MYDALDQLTLGADPLTTVKVHAFNGDGQEVDRSYPLRDYVQAEVDHGGRRFVLTSGVWFEVAADFVTEVHDFVASIPDITTSLNLPPWPESAWKDVNAPTGEGAYNEHVAAARGFALMDKKNVTVTGRQRVEMCDLLTANRQLVCVKRASRSSSLSHLFAQGSVSASLMHEPPYAEHVHKSLLTVNSQAAQSYNPADWMFVYAIATDKPGPLADTLFFFSQVHLRTHVKHITERGYKVALARVELT